MAKPSTPTTEPPVHVDTTPVSEPPKPKIVLAKPAKQEAEAAEPKTPDPMRIRKIVF